MASSKPKASLPHLNASMRPHMSRPCLVRSSSPKQETDKRNGLDGDPFEDSMGAAVTKGVRWKLPYDSLQGNRGRSNKGATGSRTTP
ncbi:uncharacterized protein LOC117586535 [Drosophila guanche]|uniref:uncharacterized protein LOC117586535 n=1 Tax=Drosophila guanche TaxID=7266 RepID=UPI00147157E2|nr:uncharacterized protein LOC117586535 [Drosophila guanche]